MSTTPGMSKVTGQSVTSYRYRGARGTKSTARAISAVLQSMGSDAS